MLTNLTQTIYNKLNTNDKNGGDEMPNLKLKSRRILKGKRQEDIAKLLGISLQSYNQKERGRRKFTFEEANKIANILDLTPEDIKDIFFTIELNTNGKAS